MFIHLPNVNLVFDTEIEILREILVRNGGIICDSSVLEKANRAEAWLYCLFLSAAKKLRALEARKNLSGQGKTDRRRKK